MNNIVKDGEYAPVTTVVRISKSRTRMRVLRSLLDVSGKFTIICVGIRIIVLEIKSV